MAGVKKISFRLTPPASNSYSVWVGVRRRAVCCIWGVLRGWAPMNRKGLPSIRARPASGCSVPVQCRVESALSWSTVDQTLK